MVTTTMKDDNSIDEKKIIFSKHKNNVSSEHK